jgi:hypothetical protein
MAGMPDRSDEVKMKSETYKCMAAGRYGHGTRQRDVQADNDNSGDHERTMLMKVDGVGMAARRQRPR